MILGMAISAQPAGTLPGLILMGQVLPNPIRNRIGFGFLKKTRTKSKSGPGFYKNLTQTWT